MNESSLCENLIVKDFGRDLHNLVSVCGKPKNPDHLYYPECEDEVYGTLSESTKLEYGVVQLTQKPG